MDDLFRVTAGFGWAVIAVAAILYLTWALKKDWRGHIESLGKIIGVAVAIISLMGVSRSLNYGAEQNQSQIRYQRLQVAFELLSRWEQDVPSIQENRRTLDSLLGKSGIEADAMLRKRPKTDVAAPIEVLLPWLNYLDRVGAAVKTEFADEEVLRVGLSSTVSLYWSRLRPWIEFYRQQQNDSRILSEFEWLADRWMTPVKS